ncbi:L-rhamnose isomerase [Saccharopolyspora rosea]|uniref:Rhamnose isomerase n=1 Tax=Saccharopolyspora rosea TaxID=524884 RepID=A0ABW3FUP8_9PSEU
MPAFDDIAPLLAHLSVELPSRAFVAEPTGRRDPFAALADVARVHEATGLTPTAALDLPRDAVRDPGALRRHAADLGVSVGTVVCDSAREEHRGLAHPDPRVRRRARDHHFRCLDLLTEIGGHDLVVHLADGTHHPGQDDLRARQDRLVESLAALRERLTDDQRLVLRPWTADPALYQTDVPDWGTCFAHCAALGERAVVGLDSGQHAPGAPVESVVAQLLRLGKLGAFGLRPRPLADDDLIVGTADSSQLFRILHEIVRGGGHRPGGVALALDPCPVEPGVVGQVRSVLTVQEMTARALLVDREALDAAQRSGDVLGAHEIFMAAFHTDVRPWLADWRAHRGLPADPAAAASGHPGAGLGGTPARRGA